MVRRMILLHLLSQLHLKIPSPYPPHHNQLHLILHQLHLRHQHPPPLRHPNRGALLLVLSTHPSLMLPSMLPSIPRPAMLPPPPSAHHELSVSVAAVALVKHRHLRPSQHQQMQQTLFGRKRRSLPDGIVTDLPAPAALPMLMDSSRGHVRSLRGRHSAQQITRS